MPFSSILLPIEIGFAALLLVLLIARPGMIRSIEGKILAVVALFVAPALAAYGGVSEHMDRSRTTAYCLSCHVMSEYGRSLRVDDPDLVAAVHFQDKFVPRELACHSCHSDYGMSGNTRAKLRGFKHVMETYFGSVPDTIKIARRYKNQECLSCHVGTRPFEESITHVSGPASLADLKSGKTSCLKSGCHDLVHEVHELDGLAMWNPNALVTEEGEILGAEAPGRALADSAPAAPGPKDAPEVTKTPPPTTVSEPTITSKPVYGPAVKKAPETRKTSTAKKAPEARRRR
jgi:NapC/NirT cytochrome c family protein